MLHIALHFIVPGIVVLWLFRTNGWVIYFVMISTMLVDVDHLLTSPVYDAMRCSIGFHMLHDFWGIGLYAILCFIPRIRYIGLGLVVHMVLDSVDCQLNTGVWFV